MTSSPLRLEAGESCTSAAALAAETMHTTGESSAPGWPRTPAQAASPWTLSIPDWLSLVETDRGTLFGRRTPSPTGRSESRATRPGTVLLGQEEELIWYTPSGMDSVGAEQWASPFDFLPDWVVPLAGGC